MPKLARDYEINRYSYTQRPEVYDYNSYRYSRYNTASVKPQNYAGYRHAKRKRSPVRFLISAAVLMLILCFALPFAFKNMSVPIFNPTPYKSVKTDMHRLAFPTTDYISNNTMLGQRSFNTSLSGKKAGMETIKENVQMPLLKQKLLELNNLYPTVNASIYVWDYETGNYIDIKADESFATASIIKLPILIDLFKSVESGNISLDDKMTLNGIYRTEGSGSLQFKAENSQYTIDELAQRMITESDNSSTNMLIAKLGSMVNVNSSLRNWGMKSTYLQTWLPDLGGTNRTSAREMATMLYNIDENEKFLTLESRQKIFNYMGHVHNNRLIQAGLGRGAVFLHKTGDIGKMLGDAGIVIAPNGKKYIVVILANRPHNAAAGKDYIVHASELIYDYMVK